MKLTTSVPTLSEPLEVGRHTYVLMLSWDGATVRDYSDRDDPDWIFHRGAFWEKSYSLDLNKGKGGYGYRRYDTVGFNPLELR